MHHPDCLQSSKSGHLDPATIHNCTATMGAPAHWPLPVCATIHSAQAHKNTTVNSTRYNSEPEREDNDSGERRRYLRRKPKARVVVAPPYHACALPHRSADDLSLFYTGSAYTQTFHSSQSSDIVRVLQISTHQSYWPNGWHISWMVLNLNLKDFGQFYI